MEVLAAYSNSRHAHDLQRCLALPRRPRPNAAADVRTTPLSIRDRLSDTEIEGIVRDHRSGVTIAALVETHGLSQSSVKRLLRAART